MVSNNLQYPSSHHSTNENGIANMVHLQNTAVCLNNIGISMIESNCFGQAIDTFKDSIALMKVIASTIPTTASSLQSSTLPSSHPSVSSPALPSAPTTTSSTSNMESCSCCGSITNNNLVQPHELYNRSLQRLAHPQPMLDRDRVVDCGGIEEKHDGLHKINKVTMGRTMTCSFLHEWHVSNKSPGMCFILINSNEDVTLSIDALCAVLLHNQALAFRCCILQLHDEASRFVIQDNQDGQRFALLQEQQKYKDVSYQLFRLSYSLYAKVLNGLSGDLANNPEEYHLMAVMLQNLVGAVQYHQPSLLLSTNNSTTMKQKHSISSNVVAACYRTDHLDNDATTESEIQEIQKQLHVLKTAFRLISLSLLSFKHARSQKTARAA